MDSIVKMIQLEGGNAVLVRSIPKKDHPDGEDSTDADEAIKPWWAAALGQAIEEKRKVTGDPARANIHSQDDEDARRHAEAETCRRTAIMKPRYGHVWIEHLGSALLALLVFSARAQAPIDSPPSSDPIPEVQGMLINSKKAAGHVEVDFKNGSSVRGEIVSSDGRALTLTTPTGATLPLSWEWIANIRNISPAWGVIEEARSRGAQGRLEEAIDLLRAARQLDPGVDVSRDLQQFESAARQRQEEEKRIRRQQLAEDVDGLLDRYQYGEALDRLREEMRDSPDDLDLLGKAVWIEYLIHLRENRAPDTYQSLMFSRLLMAEPNSPVLAKILGETATRTRLQAQWEAERARFLATAFSDAQDLIEQTRWGEARAIIDRAIALIPPPKLERQLKKLAELIPDAAPEPRIQKRIARLPNPRRGTPQRGFFSTIISSTSLRSGIRSLQQGNIGSTAGVLRLPAARFQGRSTDHAGVVIYHR